MTPRNGPADVAVIGAGASGLMAAYQAATAGATVILFEKEKRPGRKLAATGNGRCNLSHRGFSLRNFHGGQPHFPAAALQRLPESATLALFEDMGLSVVEDTRARYYPRSLQAGAVVDVLRFSCAEAGVALQTETPVQHITQAPHGFIVHTPTEGIPAKTVIVACGGAAAAPLGGSVSGYKLLEHFGHRRTAIRPGIVQLKTDPEAVRGLRGQKWDVRLALHVNGKAAAEDEGEVLFTDYGLSGPPVLQLSALAVRALAQRDRVNLHLDVVPGLSEANLSQTLVARRQSHPARSREQLLIGLLPRMLAVAHLKAIGASPLTAQAGTLTDKQLRSLAGRLKNWIIPVTGSQDLSAAQVTLGGIATDDFDPETLASWLVPGLYACGEVLDVDGDCGGYNLQWAWSSGYVAGTEAAGYAGLIP